jgi:germination protein M
MEWKVTMKKLLALIGILILCSLLGACNKKNNNLDDKPKVDIYYINTKTSGLTSESYKIISTEKKEQVKELLYMLKKTPDHMVYKSSIPEDVTLDYEFDENGSLTVNFSSSYSKLTGVPEVLCRATIVKTLSQISGVEYIQFNVNGQPLKDSNGNVVGLLTNEDFIDDTGANTYYKVKLYFANEDGDKLIEYNTDINYTGAETLEELVIKQLINGPTELGMYPTIPEGTILLNVSKNDGICFVDFNEKFLEKLPNIKEDIAIYSIVNTLVELPDINKVEFTINSQVQKTYWEDMPFDQAFERNLNLLEEAN